MSQSRIFVHASRHAEFTEAFAELVRGLQVGDPTESDTDIGPLAFDAHRDRVLAHIGAARDDGAEVIVGGGRSAGFDTGYYVDPTVIVGVERDMAIARDEVFGPVAAILSFEDRQEVIEAINALPLGLTANVWTQNTGDALETARRVQAGLVWVNGSGKKPLGVPFGGYKDSGLGREGSVDELLSYTRKKSIVVNYNL